MDDLTETLTSTYNLSPFDYARLLVVRGPLIALCIALCLAAGYAYSARQTRIYRATQIMLVTAGEADPSVVQAGQSGLNGFVVYLHSSLVAEEIARELGIGISGAELKGRAEISAPPGSSIIQINVNDTDGEAANRVAFAWGQKLIQYFDRLNANMTEAERLLAIPQDFPTYTLYRPRLIVNLGLAGVAGLLIGGALTFALEFRRNRAVRVPDDLDGLRPFPVLASIPSAESSHDVTRAATRSSTRRDSVSWPNPNSSR